MTNREEIERRRTFAIISHPDAGKTTLPEKPVSYTHLAEGCTFPLLGYYKRRQALDSRTAGNGRLARNTDVYKRQQSWALRAAMSAPR